jgi:uncharacterized protein (DUF927 family)
MVINSGTQSQRNLSAIDVLQQFHVSSEGITKDINIGPNYTKSVPICFTPISVKEILYNPDTSKTLYTLEFDGKEVVINGEDLASKRGILKLAGHGLKIIERNALDLAEYLNALISVDPSKMPIKYIYSKYGWKDDGTYVLGKKRYALVGTTDAVIHPTNKQIDAIHSQGTINEWVLVTSKMLQYNTQRFKIYVGVTPLLLIPLRQSNFSINDYGETSTGKTLTTQLVMSMWGNPKDLTLSGSSTKVGMEMTAYQFCDMPINLDDTQNINPESLVEMVYMIANGKGKVRSSRDLMLQELRTWKTVGLFTGEAPIISDMTFKGLDARLIEIKGGLGAIDTDATSLFESGMDTQYGTFASILTDYVIRNISDIKIKHDYHKQLIAEQQKNCTNGDMKNVASRISDIFATILTAGYVFETVYRQHGGIEIDYIIPTMEVFTKVVNERISDTYSSKGLDFIRGWYVSNKSYFLDDGIRQTDNYLTPKQYKIIGNITVDHVDIISSVLSEVVKKAGLNLRRLISDFKDMGLLETDSNKNQKTIRLEGNSVKVYRFKLSELNNDV